MKKMYASVVGILLIILIFTTCDAARLLRDVEFPEQLPECGTQYAPPFASPYDNVGPRQCKADGERHYKATHNGIGFEILEMESEACFVPDEAFKTLDDLVDISVSKIRPVGHVDSVEASRLRAVSALSVIGNALLDSGFVLYIPTDTLGDALVERKLPMSGAKHIVDCDTGSFIYLTVAENLSLPLSMVEITLRSGAGHNYVRWPLDTNTSMDWDINGRAECRTPTELPSYQGRSMTRAQVIGYAHVLRAPLWEKRGLFDKALGDFRIGMSMYPESPISYNNFAWMVATRVMPDRTASIHEALVAAQRAVSIERSANNLDTLACVFALAGDIGNAILTETEATTRAPGNQSFAKRLEQFKQKEPKDCTGVT